MPENQREQEHEALEAPAKLVSALAKLSKSDIFIPPTVDETILRTAHRHLVRAKEPRVSWHIFLRWAAAAAAVVVLAVLTPRLLQSLNPTRSSSLARADVNRDGPVDILDAFALARELKAGAHPNLQLDLNGDGVVDEKDVAILAARAVSLEKGGRS